LPDLRLSGDNNNRVFLLVLTSVSINSIHGCQIVNNYDGNRVIVNRYCQHLSTFARFIHVNNTCVKFRASGRSIWLKKRTKVCQVSMH
jgi:hypothetical protein